MSQSTTKKTIHLFWQHAWHYKLYTLGMLIFLPLTVLTGQYLSVFIQAGVLDRLASGNFESSNLLGSFGPALLAYLFMLAISSIGWRVVDIFNWRLAASVQRDIAQRIYAHLLSQGANFHANRFGGSLVSQTSKFLSAYDRVADTTLYQVGQLLSGLVFTVIILAPRAPLFVILLVIFTVVYIVSGIFITEKVRQLSAKVAASESAQTGYLADSVTNIMAIKSFAGSRYEHQQFAKRTGLTYRNMLSEMRANQKQMAYFATMNRLLLFISLVSAIVGVAVFKANIATVFLIFNYTGNLIDQLWNFCNSSLRNYNRSFGDARDMTKILEIEPEIKDSAHPQQLKNVSGTISFKQVDFTHQGANDVLFKNLNLEVKSGEKIGIVGHSGSGKTTFTRLLLRFSDVDGGEILIDGQNIAEVTQDDLHKQIAYVPQEPIMFHRSLTDNIRYGDFSASHADVIKAAKVAHADEFIKQLPEGYDTLVGERGVKLSGGQRQRIAIARAMIKDAPILVLDEATSALDSASEALIQDALWKLMQNRTTIVIAHRLSTVQKMDRIIVMDNGAIVEDGTHQQLLKRGGIYASLWAHQSGGFLED